MYVVNAKLLLLLFVVRAADFGHGQIAGPLLIWIFSDVFNHSTLKVHIIPTIYTRNLLSNNATQFLLISVTLFSTHYAAFYI
jgi:hypothetical protein